MLGGNVRELGTNLELNDSKFVERLSGIQQHVILLAGPNIVVLGYEIVTPIKCVSEDAEGYGQR